METRSLRAVLILLLIFILTGGPGADVQAAPLPAKGQTSLSQAEIDGLLFMREEEKLAFDVYMTMYTKWRLTFSPTFPPQRAIIWRR